MAKFAFYEAEYTNGIGETINFGSELPFRIQGIDGLDSADSEIQTKRSPFTDGTTFTDGLLKSRLMNLRMSVFADNNQQIEGFRQELFKKLSVKNGMGVLKITSETRELSINCIPQKVIAGNRGNNRLQQYQKVMIPFFAPDPSLQDVDFTTITLAAFTGGFSFPFSFPISFGTVGQSETIDNTGDTETPVLITMTAPLTNPVFTNETTGEVIDLTGGGGLDLIAGETLVINTSLTNPSIFKTDGITTVNAYSFLTSDSVLWQLALGENIVSYVAAAQSGAASVELAYKLRYGGM